MSESDFQHFKKTTHPLTINSLIARSPYGFGDSNNLERSNIYAKILQVKPILLKSVKSKYHSQLAIDVHRTYGNIFKSLPMEEKKSRLLLVLDNLFYLHPELKYYQGFHDVVSILILAIPSDEMVLAITEKLALTRFKEMLTSDIVIVMEQGLNALQRVKEIDQQLGDILEEVGCDAMFTLPWYLTWFIHSISSVEVGVRLIDFFVCSENEDFGNFIISAIISQRDNVFNCTEDSSVHTLFTDAPKSFTVDDVQTIINMTILLRNKDTTLSQLLNARTHKSSAITFVEENKATLILAAIVVVMWSFTYLFSQ
ncbi:hypothetical protein EIN_152810 [Entamoeba invadens IP1]|uniref:Rab-GAP TBC domain-containing protein n=1 Tax=Entamoeba invadens IP1 TaxID=370355 RepID=A0A0A1U8Q3_ENTIV|nr:hypothetical protein EIN_152810 [Entamoeba invadens IP1]ELP91284.1 hypothetical protein EIN_152810 [Entamoeba invadens IP1]|eukprot:XP_004258055.1 hypothetical protein EIN_152810 [Entamoeba invadens IP1]